MGRVENRGEAAAVARARNVAILHAALGVAVWSLVRWVNGTDEVAAAGDEVTSILRDAERILLAVTVGWTAVAYGIHRLWAPAWGLAVALSVFSAVTGAIDLVRLGRVRDFLFLLFELWVLRCLVNRDTLAVFTRFGSARAAPAVADEVFRPAAAPIPPVTPVAPATRQPSPANAYDFFG